MAAAGAPSTCAWHGAGNGGTIPICKSAQRTTGGLRMVSAFKGAALAGAQASTSSAAAAAPAMVPVRAAQATSRVADTAEAAVLMEGETPAGVELKGKVVLSRKNLGILVDIPALVVDNYAELFQERRVEIELVSADLDPKTGRPKVSRPSTIQGWAKSTEIVLSGDREFGVTFSVAPDFGEPGAIFVRNHHPREFLLVSLTLEKPDKSVVEFACNSWIYNTSKYSSDRVFFSNKAYLPENTPAGLRALREQELRTMQGDGTGERREWDRVYDFDVYDDLGNPDWTWDGKRPTLGGKERPYPRRMRTGRARALFDPKAEKVVNMFTGNLKTGPDPLGNYYIPRDEKYARVKYTAVLLGSVWGMLHGIVPVIKSLFSSTPNEFRSLQDIRDMYEESADKGGRSWFKYPLPQVAHANDMACLDDEEFARQTVAGFSPVVIERVREYPPKGATALTNAHIEPYMEGLTVDKAIESKRLFKVDYHDLFMPFVERINAQKNRKTYATRVFLFLSGEGKLKPIAIELALPRAPAGAREAIRVVTPPKAGEGKDWFWELAKLHASSVDFTYHELITHWLETHASMEPLIIATHRQLSAMHPMKVLLAPHLINTLCANSSARQVLVSAGGYIELFFIPGRACTMEMSAAGYPGWRFDRQALPADLVARGMAEPDPDMPGGVRLVLDDYPYAKDGLELWDALRRWVRACVRLAYGDDDAAVRADAELQAWYRDIRERGHGDHAAAAWWPPLDTVADAEHVLATVAWIASGRHSAVHYGQFPYAGYVLNRPCFLRRLVPEPGTPEAQALQADPDAWLLGTLPSVFKNFAAVTGAETLSVHPDDEEYMGTRARSNWTADPALRAAFDDFAADLRALERHIDERNADPSLHHRSGPARMPYTMLAPSSKSGITARGVPYSMCA